MVVPEASLPCSALSAGRKSCSCQADSKRQHSRAAAQGTSHFVLIELSKQGSPVYLVQRCGSLTQPASLQTISKAADHNN